MDINNLPIHINNQIIQYIQADDDIIVKHDINISDNTTQILLQPIIPIKLSQICTKINSNQISIRMKLLRIIENIFLIETSTFGRRCYFKGNHKLTFADRTTCIHLTPQANVKLFNYLYNQYSACSICNKNFNITLTSNGIKINDQIIKLSHSECQCKNRETTISSFNIHAACMESAFITCPGNGKEICNNRLINTDHLTICFNGSACGTRTCSKCRCNSICNKCNKWFCRRISHNNSYCDGCLFQCEICNNSCGINDKYSCELCKQHSWCSDCLRISPIILKTYSPNFSEIPLNVICIECDKKSHTCKKCKNICYITDLANCENCNNTDLCKNCLTIAYNYDDTNLIANKIFKKCINYYTLTTQCLYLKNEI
jgi:hypothetical protein